jgi:hypothetical protein
VNKALALAALHAWRNRQMGLTVMGTQATEAPEQASLFGIENNDKKVLS